MKTEELKTIAAETEMKLRGAIERGYSNTFIARLARDFCTAREKAVRARRDEFNVSYPSTGVASCPCCGRGCDSSGDCPECGLPHGD